ncbi:MAG TPA: SDR family oxidoreductase [Solirubrobacteraceae bacterium]|nr:SDR family oxidoreductase [Solirubrobacteraceae bacterium]
MQQDPQADGIHGKVVAITGAGSGIGEATALHLAARGAKVVLGGRRVERVAEVTERIERAGGAAAAVATDVTQRADLERLVDTARERFGRLDVLVANAGVMPIGPLDALDVDSWGAMVDTNLKGVLHGIAAALPVFRAQGAGHFVTTSSTAAFRVVPTMAVYAATKTAVHVLCEGLRQEAGGTVRVTEVAPGFVHTDSPGHISDPETRAQIAEARDRIAIPPDAIARAMAFAIAQPADVDVNEIVVRPTAQD